MEEDFIYWRHPSVPGIKIEEVTGGERYKGGVWLEMARQLYCENGKDEYREIGHFANGAPFLYGEPARISVTHCPGLFAVATLAPTPDADLAEFNPLTALGIDAERSDREQVLKVRDRFLSPAELEMIPADGVLLNVQAWTLKEALYKARLLEGLDFRKDIVIRKLPKLGPPTPVFDAAEFGLPRGQKKLPEEFFGEATVAGEEFRVYSYLSDGESVSYVVSLAYSPASARYVGEAPSRH